MLSMKNIFFLNKRKSKNHLHACGPSQQEMVIKETWLSVCPPVDPTAKNLALDAASAHRPVVNSHRGILSVLYNSCFNHTNRSSSVSRDCSPPPAQGRKESIVIHRIEYRCAPKGFDAGISVGARRLDVARLPALIASALRGDFGRAFAGEMALLATCYQSQHCMIIRCGSILTIVTFLALIALA